MRRAGLRTLTKPKSKTRFESLKRSNDSTERFGNITARCGSFYWTRTNFNVFEPEPNSQRIQSASAETLLSAQHFCGNIVLKLTNSTSLISDVIWLIFISSCGRLHASTLVAIYVCVNSFGLGATFKLAAPFLDVSSPSPSPWQLCPDGT